MEIDLVMDSVKQNLISSFNDVICWHSDTTATQLLEATGWNLEAAIELYYLQNENRRTDQSSRGHGDAEVRHRAVWEANRCVDEPTSTSQDNLVSLYRPPLDLMHIGSFQQARHEAKDQDKWLIINVQSHKEFNSHALNRDTWANDAVAETIKANFVFWQIYEDVTEGKKARHNYKLDKFPAVLVVDPITGQRVRSWIGAIEPEGFLEDLFSYVDSGPKASLARKPTRRPSGSSHIAQGTAVENCEVDKETVRRALTSLNIQNDEVKSKDKEMIGDVHNKKETLSGEKYVYPNLPEEEPTGGDVRRVGIRLPCGRRVRRSFLKTDSIKLLWSFCSTLLAKEDCLRSFHFTQGRALASKNVEYDCKLTFEESELSNTMISLVWD